MTKLPIRLKELREEKGLSVQELATALKISRRAIYRWENSERVPNVDYALILARFFNVSTDYLLGNEEFFK